MSKWPMWRTPSCRDTKPIIAAGLLLVLPATLLGLALLPFLNTMLGPMNTFFNFMVICLIFSPFALGLALTVILPVAIFAARRSWAGWAVAALAGGAYGWLFGLPWGVLTITQITTGLGICFGTMFWLILRLRSPHLFISAPIPGI